MGAQGSIGIRVNFDRPNSVFLSGEQITGNVSAYNIIENIQFEEIYLEFIGELGYSTEETRQRIADDKTSQTERYIEHHVVQFVKIPISVIASQNFEGEKFVNHGQYSWPFDVTIPKRLPPSLALRTNSNVYVKYYIQIFLDKPYFKSDNEKIYPLTIYPCVNLTPILKSSNKPPSFSYTNRKDVELKGYVLRAGFLSDEKISIHLNLNNPKQAAIKRIEAVLTQYRQIGRDHHEDTIFQVNLPDIKEFNENKYEQTIDLALPPQHIAPSYQFKVYCNQRSFPIITKYELELKVKAHGLLTDFDVKVPIIIGTELSTDQDQINKPI